MSDLELARAARKLADDSADRLAKIPATPQFIGTVTSTSPLQVTWRGKAVTMAGKDKNYTPTVGDRVVCLLLDGQPLIDFAIG